MTHSDGGTSEEHSDQTESQSTNEETTESSETATSSQSEISSSYNNIYNNNSDFETHTSSQSEITTEYDASSEPSKQRSFKTIITRIWQPISENCIFSYPRNGNNPQNYAWCHSHSQRTAGQSGDEELLNQQKAIAANKLNAISRSRGLQHLNTLPWAMSLPEEQELDQEKANGVTSGSSEDSDCEPQTFRMARFQALKRWFETPTKSEEESPSHRTLKRQRLFQKSSSQSATDCPSKEYRTPGPYQRSNGTASEGEWARLSSQEDQPHCKYCT